MLNNNYNLRGNHILGKSQNLRGSRNILGKNTNSKKVYYKGRSSLADAVYTNDVPKGFKLDEEFNQEKQKVFLDKNNRPIIAYRGTVLTDLEDLGNDALLLVGLEGFSNRFQNSVDFAKKVVDKYGKENVSLVGHSLGSAIANYVSAKTDIPGEGFNTPNTLNTFNPFSYLSNSKINNYKSNYDIISALNPRANTWENHNYHSIEEL